MNTQTTNRLRDQFQASTGLQVLALCALWVIVSVVGRLWIETPSFKPVMAVAILGGFLLRDRRLALMLPLLVMATTDFFLGVYDWSVMVAVYACIAVPALWSKFVPASGSMGKIASLNAAAICSAIVFYVVVNFAVWAFTPWYVKDLAGLSACYVAAIPFLNWMILGNLFFVNSLAIGSALLLQTVKNFEQSTTTEQAC